MTMLFPFTPSNTRAPSFQMTFDGNTYTVTVTWNLFGQRYYVNCFDGSGNLVFTVALIQSPEAMPLLSLAWSATTLQVTAQTTLPHGLALGSIAQLTIENATPDGYNGAFDCFITGPSTFVYPVAENPEPVVAVGTVSYLISMCAGYFDSTLIFRNMQFEVSP
jgi:hypothetical protein